MFLFRRRTDQEEVPPEENHSLVRHPREDDVEEVAEAADQVENTTPLPEDGALATVGPLPGELRLPATTTTSSPAPIRVISNIPSLVAVLLASCTTGGTVYAFGLYSAALKKNWHLSQEDIDTISSALFMAGLFSWIPGLLVDRMGTRAAMGLGGGLSALTLLAYWAVSRHLVPLFFLSLHQQQGSVQMLAEDGPSSSTIVIILSILGVAVFLSNSLVIGAVFKVFVMTCGPGTKGQAVGAGKGYLGLGSGLYACLFDAIQRPGESDLDFLLMAAVLALLGATLPAVLWLPATPRKSAAPTWVWADEATPRHFHTLYFSLLAMITLIVGHSMHKLWTASRARRHYNVPPYSNSTATHHTTDDLDDDNEPSYAWGLLLLAVWILPILSWLFLPRRRNLGMNVVALESFRDECDYQDGGVSDPAPSDATTFAMERRPLLPRRVSSVVGRPANRADEENQHHHTLLEMLQTHSAWLLLWTLPVLVGGGTVMTNNMGQMVESLGFDRSVTSASLALFSVSQAISRVVTGAMSEAALNWNTRAFGLDNGVPRPFFLVVAALLSFLAHTILVWARHEVTFVLGSTLAGAAFGMVWPLMVLMVGEVYGLEHVAANYMFFDGCAAALGTLFLSKIVAQKVYQDHIDAATAPDPHTCLGAACFRSTQVAIALLSLSCVATSWCFMRSTRAAYNRPSLHT